MTPDPEALHGYLSADPEATAIRDERVKRSGSGRIMFCAFAGKRMYPTNRDAKWTAGRLHELGYLLAAYPCPHPKASHHHLTSGGFTTRALRRATQRRAQRGTVTVSCTRAQLHQLTASARGVAL